MRSARLLRLPLGLLLLAGPAVPGGRAWGDSPATPNQPPPKSSGTHHPPHKAPRPHSPPPKAAHPHPPPRPPVVSPRPAPAKQPARAKPASPAPPAVVPTPPPPPEAKSPAVPAPPAKGTVTGLPLPRFAALRSDEVNLRSGPGTRYPIQWVYKRRDLPVEIEREFEVWRLVRDPDGVKGWVHQATLTGRRSFVVTGTERTLRREANEAAAPVAILKPGVIGRIRSCQAGEGWCQVQVGDHRGWLQRDAFWGSYPGEAVNP